MNMKSVKEEFKNLNLTIRHTEFGEYRVNFKGASEDTAYYASDIEDAYSTGLVMLKGRKM